MTIRKPCLPAGWYPRRPEEIAQFLKAFEPCEDEAPAAVAPHAGWYYSGALAAKAVASLRRSADTVVVLGGHLPAGFPPLYAEEDAVSLPQGLMELDDEFRRLLLRRIPGGGDRFQDNTVEVLLPMVKHFFPVARLLWLRLPADPASLDAGTAIAQTAAALGRNFVLLGSTDLTHYGSNYGFSPQGAGPEALAWVKTKNDKAFIDAVLASDPALVLRRALDDRSACSPGPVLACLGCAEYLRAGPPSLLSYATSADTAPSVPDSFVGYAALNWAEAAKH
ncbi:MAG: AmmeMemoRadiSam system protein B [Spirochaetaceae bacterium]|nr:AmmeMemoRadiSam system protein B [Spirochaetaceae bacterium]